MYYNFKPYVNVATRKKKAALAVAKLTKKGQIVSPVVLTGRTISGTFWGKAWCRNLESIGDYENRLPRGRSYLTNGAVVDLQIDSGEVRALVSGSSLYKVTIAIQPPVQARWKSLMERCSGSIGSVVELLQGKLSKSVMEILASRQSGLFPTESEIAFECTCPDWAEMCKHVAAVLYGVGARLDSEPELLFRLRQVDQAELVAHAAAGGQLTAIPADSTAKVVEESRLSEIFGIDIEETPAAAPARVPAKKAKAAKTKPIVTSRSAVVDKPAAKPAGPAKRKSKPAAKAPKSAARAPKTISPAAGSGESISTADLLAKGVPKPLIQKWLRSGIIERSEKSGIYRTTCVTDFYITKATAGR